LLLKEKINSTLQPKNNSQLLG